MSSKQIDYRDAGVDIDAGDALVESISPLAAATKRPGVMGGLGGFGGLFDLKACGYEDPLLVGATDGVGTKLLGGIQSGLLDGLGQDLVAMCVNDLICQGASPLFFLDYFATGKLEPQVAKRIIASIAQACKASNCALIGGETAEMPQMYAEGHFDLAGFAVGAVERDQMLPNQGTMKAGQRLVGWTSNGVHSNGFSLVRKVLENHGLSWEDPAPWLENGDRVADDLMRPTRLYVAEAEACRDHILGLVHVTGGGLPGNVGRMLPDRLAAQINIGAWQRPAFFAWVVDQGYVAEAEAFRAFNMGIGLVAVLKDGHPVPPGAIDIGVLVERDTGGSGSGTGDGACILVP